jgi:hypothetical protein
MKDTVFWNVTPCRAVNILEVCAACTFRGSFSSILMIKSGQSSKMLLPNYMASYPGRPYFFK